MLRQKTLLGETYVEITPGDPQSPAVPDGGKLPVRNITPTVELDEIVQTFDPKTRAAFAVWQEELATASAGRGQDINDFFGVLPPLVDQATRLLTILNEDEDDLSRLVSNTGRVFAALSARGDQLQGLFENTNRVFATTAERNQQLAQTFVAFPTFQRESRLLLERTAEFAETTDPLITDLKPAAAELGPTMAALERVRAGAERPDGGSRPGPERVRQGPAGGQQLPQGRGAVLRSAQPRTRAAQPARAVPRRIPGRADVVLRERHRRDERQHEPERQADELHAHHGPAESRGARGLSRRASSPTATRRTTSRARCSTGSPAPTSPSTTRRAARPVPRRS